LLAVCVFDASNMILEPSIFVALLVALPKFLVLATTCEGIFCTLGIFCSFAKPGDCC